jgi:hypothetical protein
MHCVGMHRAHLACCAHALHTCCCHCPCHVVPLPHSQAKEIGGLLTRLTNENAAFLKLKDAAAAARDEALNRVTALEMEVEMLQQQLR